MGLFSWLRKKSNLTDQVVAGRIPASRIMRTISSMKEGESGWVRPTNVDVDANWFCYLWEKSEVTETRTGQHSVKITLTANGWVVDLSHCTPDVKWIPSNYPLGIPVMVVYQHDYEHHEYGD